MADEKPTHSGVFMFHAEIAPEGQFFASDADVPVGKGWVDTPAKFDPDYVAPAPKAGEDAAAEASKPGVVKVLYPSCRYKNGDPDNPKRVENEDEDRALELKEPGVWKHSPDPAFHQPPPKSKAKDAAKDPPGSGEKPPTPPVAQTDEQKKAELYAAKVTDIVATVSAMTDKAMLEQIATFELDNPKGARSTVGKAVKARLRELDAPAG